MALVAFLFGLSGRDELPGPALRALLADVGFRDDAARALLSRMARAGQLSSHRHGREASYRLAGSTARGFHYIRRRSGTSPASSWDGTFHTVLHRVPEGSRAFRDALRRAAQLAGYGVLQPGVLVAPRDYRDQLAAVLTGQPEGSQVVFGRLQVDESDAPAVIAAAWDLSSVAATYLAHVEALTAALGRDADDPAAALRAFALTVAPALSATLGEPDVPPELLPEDWPGPRLRALVERCGRRYGAAAARRAAEVLPR